MKVLRLLNDVTLRGEVVTVDHGVWIQTDTGRSFYPWSSVYCIDVLEEGALQ